MHKEGLVIVAKVRGRICSNRVLRNQRILVLLLQIACWHRAVASTSIHFCGGVDLCHIRPRGLRRHIFHAGTSLPQNNFLSLALSP